MAVDLLVEHRALTSFLGHLSGVLVSTRDPAERIRRLLEPFRHMLMEDFLPPEYREARRGAVVQYLLYRSSDKSASIVATVIPPGVRAPVHDHGAWGLRGVYQGVQKETAYLRQDDGAEVERALLIKGRRQRLRAGDVAGIIPPHVDIHEVEATSKIPAISITLLGTDPGCQERHVYDPRSRSVRTVRLGYANVGCDETEREGTS